MSRSLSLLALALLAGACATDQPTAPQPDSPSLKVGVHSTVSTAMSHLDSPRGLAWGADGSLYVVEAGNTTITGPCAVVARGANCYSGTGAISRLRDGVQERVASGLPSLINTAAGDISGPHDIEFPRGGGPAYVSIGWGGAPAARADLGSLGDAFGTLIQVEANGHWRIAADVTAFEDANNPAGGPLDSNPFGILVTPRGSYVADAGGNSLLEVAPGGAVSLVATFAALPVPLGPFNPPFTESDPVPTEVTRGPGDALYVSQLTGVPFLPGAAGVYRVAPGQAPTLYAGGFTAITDMDWGADGSLYVLQYASAPFLGGPGSIIRVAPDGSRSTIVAGLPTPTGILVGGPGTVYVSVNGNLEGVGEVLRIDF